MTLNQLGQLFLEQAKEKGWGHTKEMLSVSEKMMLINTEISELYEAMHSQPQNPKDTMESELSDILGRTLHLGLVWEVNFDSLDTHPSSEKINQLSDGDYLHLHILVSQGYDYYRHKEIDQFKQSLLKICDFVLKLGAALEVDLTEACLNKIEINKSRVWDKTKLIGNYYK